MCKECLEQRTCIPRIAVARMLPQPPDLKRARFQAHSQHVHATAASGTAAAVWLGAAFTQRGRREGHSGDWGSKRRQLQRWLTREPWTHMLFSLSERIILHIRRLNGTAKASKIV